MLKMHCSQGGLFSQITEKSQRISLEAALASNGGRSWEFALKYHPRRQSEGLRYEISGLRNGHTSCPVTILGGCAGSADMATVNNKYGPIGIGASAEYVLTGKT